MAIIELPTAGATPRVGARPPDPFDGQRHTVRSDGRVVRRGTAYVHADDSALTWDLTAPCAHEVSAVREVWAEHVETHFAARTGARGGTRGLDLSRMADLILAGTGTPRMLGTDAVSWEQVVTVPVGALQADLEALATALHLNYADPWDAAREVLGIPRPNTPGAIGCRHEVITRPTVAKRSARLSVTMGRARRGDPIDTFGAPLETAPAYCHVFGVLRLVAPGPTRETRFVGHRLVARPPVHAKRRAAKREQVRKSRTVDLTLDQIEQHADSLAPGTRARFTCGTLSGTIARADGGAWSVRVKRDDGRTIARSTLRQARYVRNVIANAAR